MWWLCTIKEDFLIEYRIVLNADWPVVRVVALAMVLGLSARVAFRADEKKRRFDIRLDWKGGVAMGIVLNSVLVGMGVCGSVTAGHEDRRVDGMNAWGFKASRSHQK